MITSNNEKQFKIEKVEKYTDEINEVDKKIVIHTSMLGASALVVIMSLMDISLDETVTLFNNLFAYLGTLGSSWNLKKMVELILNKTMLQSKQEDIINEIEEFENRVNGGMSR